MSTSPQEVADMRAKIRSLNYEVSRLKGLEPEVERLQNLLQARDQEIAEGQRQQEALEDHASEVKTLMCEVLVELTKVGEAKDNLAAELGSSQAQGKMLESELNTANSAKEKAVAEQKVATELQKDAESRYKRLHKKYHHYKAKAKRYLKQLSLVPWLRDLGWARGFIWGFENYRTLVLNPQCFNFCPETVSHALLGIPDEAIHELEQMGVDHFPDVPEWGESATSPWEVGLSPLHSTSEPTSDIAVEGDGDHEDL
jgi:hypothetical protein